MNPRETVFAAIRREEVHPIPVTLAMEDEVADRLDAHYGTDAWRSRRPRYMVGVSGFDTDIKFPAENPALRIDPYGSVWRVDRRPWHLERPALADPTLDGAAFPALERFLVPGAEAAAVAAAEAARGASFVYANVGWGLFERSWTMRGFENALVDMVAEEDFYAELLDRLTDLYVQFAERACAWPVDGLLFGDDWGDQRGVIMGPELWRKWFKPRWARIFAAVKAHGRVTMCHSCGSVADIVPDLAEIGLDVLESVQPEAAGMDLASLKARYGDRIAFWGGLGSQSVIPFATPEALRAEMIRLARVGGAGGGYILAPAKPLQPETPTANAAAIVDYLCGPRED